MLHIDGSTGEGGGQVLRTALTLSLVTGTPFRMTNIRAGRSKPGLLRQHLAAVQAAAAVGKATVSGAELGARELVFEPRGVHPGEYHFAVSTAGSATLVLQTVLPALASAVGGASALLLEGGTHNPAAPPFDFIAKAYLPLLRRMGPAVEAELGRPGFAPAGGGRFRVTVQPAPLRPFSLLERGNLLRRQVRAVVAQLPYDIARRELDAAREVLGWQERELRGETWKDSRGPGNVVSVALESEHVTEVFTSFGEKGVPAEEVGTGAAQQARRYLDAGVPVGQHLCDQLLLLLGLARGGSFRTLPLDGHATTQVETLTRFLDVRVEVTHVSDEVREVTVRG